MTMIKDTEQAYFDHPYLSRSDILKLNDSYNSFLYARKENQKKRRPLTVGSLLHCLILEPENFDKKFVLFDGKKRHGKKYDEFLASHPDQNIVISSELADAQRYASTIPGRMKEKIYADGCAHEISVYSDKLKLKCRADTLNEIEHHIYDIKTILNIKKISSCCASYGYHIQAALYCRVLEDVTGHSHDFNLYFVDKETSIWHEAEIHQDDIDIANRLIDRGIRMHENKTNYTGRTTVRLPQYYRNEMEELMEADLCI